MQKYYFVIVLRVVKVSYALFIVVGSILIISTSLAFSLLVPRADERPRVGIYDNAESRIVDTSGDVKPLLQHGGTSAILQIRDYHDIVSANVVKRGGIFFFTINLAGNPNSIEEYETLYRWHVITDQMTDRERHYTILLPNFGQGSANSTLKGWYYAVFDNTANTYAVRPIQIIEMPVDGVEFGVKDQHIGDPDRFLYWVEVLVRPNATFGEPDYLMDDAP